LFLDLKSAEIDPKRGHRRLLISAESGHHASRRSMTQTTFTTALTLEELAANHEIYCKALRILIREETPIDKIQRSVCWRRLDTLHRCLPDCYSSPQRLVLQIQRSLAHPPSGPGL
jgi:hypothetical protein